MIAYGTLLQCIKYHNTIIGNPLSALQAQCLAI